MRRPFLLAALFCACNSSLLFAPCAIAENTRPRYDWRRFDTDLEIVLKKRLDEATNAIRIRADNVEQFKKIMDQLGYDLPDDPEAIFDFAKDFIDRNKSFDRTNLHSKQKKDLEDALKKISKLPQPQGLPPMKKGKNPTKRNTETKTSRPQRNQPPGIDDDFFKISNSQLERSRIGEMLRDSTAFKNAVEDWRRHMIAGDTVSAGDWQPPWTPELPDLGDLWAKMPQADFSSNMPEVDLPLPSLEGFNMPTAPPIGMPAGGAPSVSDAGQLALALLLLVLCGILAWQILQRTSRRRKVLAESELLGPWPVNPRKISTAAELIAAFEYLGLLRLGRKARAWNHRIIADRLREQPTSDEEAAEQLALLYQQARYAPDNEKLADDTISRARQYVCQLAGLSLS